MTEPPESTVIAPLPSMPSAVLEFSAPPLATWTVPPKFEVTPVEVDWSLPDRVTPVLSSAVMPPEALIAPDKVRVLVPAPVFSTSTEPLEKVAPTAWPKVPELMPLWLKISTAPFCSCTPPEVPPRLVLEVMRVALLMLVPPL